MSYIQMTMKKIKKGRDYLQLKIFIGILENLIKEFNWVIIKDSHKLLLLVK